MARNYRIGEAVEIIAEGTDVEAIQDLGRRYPLLVAKIAKATAGANTRDVVELFSFIPEYVSANKVNKIIKATLLGDVPETDDDGEEEEKPAKKAPAKKAPAKKKSNNPYAGMSAIDLFKECKKKGIKAAPKKTNKYYIDLLTKAEEEADEDDGWDEEEEETPKKPAKKAGRPKKKPEPEPVDDDDDDDDDDWDI